MSDYHGIDRGLVKAGVKGAADATFRMGTLEAGNKAREVELRQHMRSAMLAWLGSTVFVMLPVWLFTRNPSYGFGASMAVMGTYSMITGRAVLKPGPTQHSLLLGWKARTVGAILLLAALFIYFGGEPSTIN